MKKEFNKISEEIFLQACGYKRFVAPITGNLVRIQYATLEWYKNQGWEGVVGVKFAVFGILQNMGCSWHALHWEDTTINEKISLINSLRNVSPDEVFAKYKKNIEKDYVNSWAGDPEYYYFRSDALIKTFSKHMHREFFINLALKGLEFDGRLLIELAADYSWPNLVLCKGDSVRFVKIKSHYFDNDRHLKEAKLLNDLVLDPLKIKVDIVKVSSKETTDFFSSIPRQTVNLKRKYFNSEAKNFNFWESPISKEAVRVELAALDWYKLQGWNGVFGESNPIKCLWSCLDLIPHPAARESNQAKLNLITEDIIVERFREKGWPRINYITEKDLICIYRHLTTEQMLHMASHFTQAGWPDLILYNESELMFVEVKSPTDKIHESQFHVIFNILKPVNLKIVIFQVEDKKHKLR